MNGKERCLETPVPPTPPSVQSLLYDLSESVRRRFLEEEDDYTEAKLRAAWHEIAALSSRVSC